MTPLEQAKKFDAILKLFLNRGFEGATYEEINQIYSSVNGSEVCAYLVGLNLLYHFTGTGNNKLNHCYFNVTAKGKLFLDAGGFTAEVEHKNEMDSYVKQSTLLSESTLKLTEDSIRLEKSTLKVANVALCFSIFSFIVSLLSLAISDIPYFNIQINWIHQHLMMLSK